MNYKTKVNRLKLPITIFILFLIVLISFFYYIFEQNKKSYLIVTTKKYVEAYNTIYDQHKEFSEIFYTGVLNKTKIYDYLYKYNSLNKNEINSLRNKIINNLNERRKIFKNKNLSNINIILPDETVFLNYKHLENTNKIVCSKNLLIPLVIKEKKFKSSFGVGNCGSGYRFAYPLIKNKILIGVIEFVFDSSAFTKTFMKQYPVLSNFFTFSSAFDNKFLEQTKLYKPSHHKGLLFNTEVLKELKNISKKDMKKLIPKENIVKQLRENFDKKIPLTLYDTNIDMLFTSIPIINKISNKNEAVLTIRSMGTDFSRFNKDYYIIVSLLILIMFLVSILIYYNSLKQDQDQLLHEQSKMAQMGEMLENIAHQWRQPLSVITTVTSATKFQREFGNKNEEDLNKNLNLILNSANHLSDTINDFRDFYKKDRKANYFSLNKAIEKSTSLLISQLKNRDIKIINDIKEIQVFGYKNEIIQVFMNLFKNAIDELDKIENEEKLIIIHMEMENNQLILTFQDNAGGIKDNIINNIFDKHFTTKENKNGTGIGLYMSKLMIKKSNGNISVENRSFTYNNKDYKGACFIVYLPL